MPITINEFWKLAVASELLSVDRCRKLHAAYLADHPGAAANAEDLAQWLVRQGTLTAYQASLLAAGRPGPFVFNDFVIDDRIERGRLAGLFRARYKQTQRALLIFVAQLTGPRLSDEAVAQAAQTIAKVKSPHLVRVHALVTNAANRFIVAQDLTGESLRERLAREPITVPTACGIAQQIALGLAALDTAGIRHGHLAPENVWLESSRQARLMAFPFVGGAPLPAAYQAPELSAQGQSPTLAADLYSLGRVLLAMLGEENTSTKDTTRVLSELAANTSPALSDLLKSLLDPQPARRPQSAEQVAATLAAVAQSAAAVSPAPEPSTAATEPPRAAAASPDWEPPSPFATTSKTKAKATAEKPRHVFRLWLAGTGLALALILGIMVLAFRGQPTASTRDAGQTADSRDPSKNNAPTEASAAPAEVPNPDAATVPPGSPAAKYDLIDDDGKTLWASPTTGKPLDLRYLPAGSQVIFVLRPAEILANPEGPKLLDACGPASTTIRSQLAAAIGFDLQQLEQLLIAFFPGQQGDPQVAYRVRLTQPATQTELVAAWNQPAPGELQGKRFFKSSAWVYIPLDDEIREVAVLPPGVYEDALANSGAPLLPPGIERLVARSDDARQFNLFFAPSYLFTDGRALLVGDLARLADPLARFLGESIDGVLASVQLGEQLFVELRVANPLEKSAQETSRALAARWDAVPDEIETYVASLAPNPHGRLVVNRFPRMVQLLRDYTRAGVDDQQAVLRAYLPLAAAHNLTLGAQLTLAESPAAGRAKPTTEPEPQSVADKLARRINLSTLRETFDRCLDMLAKEIDAELVILGADLQAEGITQNKSLNNINERDLPAGEILRKLLQLADPDGKLVYVIKPGPSGGEAIHITTRAAAERRGDPLPAEFTAKS